MTVEAERARDAGMPGDSKQIAIRMPKELLDRVDAYVEKLHRQTGLRPSQAVVLKLLVERGLDAVESEGASKKKR